MRIRIKHETNYHYSQESDLGPHLIRLRPAEHTRAQVLSYNLEVAPDCELRWQHDAWGNRVARVTFPAERPAETLALSVDLSLEIRPVNPFDFFVDDRCKYLPCDYPDGLSEELAPFLSPVRPGKLLSAWMGEQPYEGKLLDWLVDLNRRVAQDVRYIIRNEPGLQTSEQTLERRSGSCRDCAVLIVDALRSCGLAARFASGYLVQLADEGIIPDAAKGVSSDVVDLHAWAEVYVPGAGWVGLDGTSGLLCGEGHVPLACTVNPELAAPVTGSSSQPATAFEVHMDVARLGHEPRPRRPYTDEAWQAVLNAGEQMDANLRRQGLALTIGGEPTWTSREHPGEPEWNTEALGPTKLAQGLRLAEQLGQRMGAGALALQRMGKQYPGESLPRWALHVITRKDGVAVWRDPARLSFSVGSEVGRDELGELLAAGRRLGESLGRRLGIEPELMAGYEDPWHFIREEEDLPAGVDPLESDLDDSEERRRLARVLQRGLGSVVGWALPLRHGPGGWETARWTFRRGELFLVPGDSPMGLRLPLERLGGEPPVLIPADVTEDPGALDESPRQPRRCQPEAVREGTANQLLREVTGREARPSEEQIITTLCIEPREGRLHVFLPPQTRAEAFLELVAAVEEAAADQDLVLCLEGYPPPADPRLQTCVVTPDPGVIEVNLPVAESFSEYVESLEMVNGAANHAGLTTERYQLDGREAGSGGGNHLTLGGPTTTQSPFLLRPDILASLVCYIQNHPSLSYLFSGLFVGPTSEAPRIDEARHESLYELEIALRQVPGPEVEPRPAPWASDRLFRNLLVDLSGNTHRAEVCIDKLYNPSGPAGRQGLVELRAFEMPPHERMAAAQMLLMRGIATMVAAQPRERSLVRWGAQLHDRFMLPHYLWADLEDVIEDVRRADLPFESAWFRPFLEQRFPVMGRLEVDDISLEVRSALEPWPVLGEEHTGASVSRYVDSSLERVQVLVDGVTEGRHVITVNGLMLPMRPTGRAAEQVAGVRFRAWQPPSCLQPQIGIHHPLHFDIVDTWADRSLGGCAYHVWHPSGQGYDDPPLTAFEAAARRAQRFTRDGHAPYPVKPIPTKPHPDEPFTLDLRRYPGDRPPPAPKEPEEE